MNRCLSDQGFRGEGGYRVVAGKDEADNVGMDAIPIFDIRIQIFFNLVLENPRKLTYWSINFIVADAESTHESASK